MRHPRAPIHRDSPRASLTLVMNIKQEVYERVGVVQPPQTEHDVCMEIRELVRPWTIAEIGRTKAVTRMVVD